MGNCNTEYDVYGFFVCLSLLLTAVVFVYANKQNNFAGDPEKGKKFFGILAGFKILLGVLLLTVLYPSDCANFQSFYGVVAIIIGLIWVSRAKKCADMEPKDSGAAEMPSVVVNSAAGKQEIV